MIAIRNSRGSHSPPVLAAVKDEAHHCYTYREFSEDCRRVRATGLLPHGG
jgi:hypothetical protein